MTSTPVRSRTSPPAPVRALAVIAALQVVLAGLFTLVATAMAVDAHAHPDPEGWSDLAVVLYAAGAVVGGLTAVVLVVPLLLLRRPRARTGALVALGVVESGLAVAVVGGVLFVHVFGVAAVAPGLLAVVCAGVAGLSWTPSAQAWARSR